MFTSRYLMPLEDSFLDDDCGSFLADMRMIEVATHRLQSSRAGERLRRGSLVETR